MIDGSALALAGLQAAIKRAEERESDDRMADLPIWRPQPGPQSVVWDLDCDEVLYGGAAGGGKTMLAAALPLQLLGAPRGRMLVLRRNTNDLAEIIDLAKRVFITGDENGAWSFRPAAPGNAKIFDKNWLYVNGDRLRVWFGHCDHVDDWGIYMGHQFDKIVFDEVVQFAERQYDEISGRLRGSIKGIRRQIIATTNPPRPDEPGNSWVRKRWAPWLDKNCALPSWEKCDEFGNVVAGVGVPEWNEGGERLPPAESAQILYVGRVDPRGEELFSAKPFSWQASVEGKRITFHAQSRTYVRSLLSDNQALLEGSPNYAATLAKNDPVRTRQLLHGDWEASYERGEMFRRTRFEMVDAVPLGHCVWRRAWDFAGTKPSDTNKDPDWTIGLKLGRHEDGFFYIAHVHRMRDEPGEVESMRAHYASADGSGVKQLYPRDPAEAGKTAAALRVAAAIEDGAAADMIPATKNVLSKAAAVSSAAHPKAFGREDGPGNYGRIRVVRGEWNDAFFDILEGFPRARHDDDVSALADAYNDIMSAPQWVPPVTPSGPVDRPRFPAQMRFNGRRGFG